VHPDKHRSLVRETRWIRVYQTGPKELHYESKFITDDIRISVDELKREWNTFSEQDQLEFAQAFMWKGLVLPEDQAIMDFVMDSGPEVVWSTIAPLLPKYPDREKALSFLLQRIAQQPTDGANYYQALELIADRRAVPLLRQCYGEHVKALGRMEQHNIFELVDYLCCCRALWRLDGSPEYEHALREMLKHPDDSVRRWVEKYFS
jgi:hypothetical protein